MTLKRLLNLLAGGNVWLHRGGPKKKTTGRILSFSERIKHCRGDRTSVLVVHFDEALLHADVNRVLSIVVTDPITIFAAGYNFAAAGGNADLNENAGRLAAVAGIVAGAGVFDFDDLLDGTAGHFVKILVLHVAVEFNSSGFGCWSRGRCGVLGNHSGGCEKGQAETCQQ